MTDKTEARKNNSISDWLHYARRDQPNRSRRIVEPELDICVADLPRYAGWAINKNVMILPTGTYVVSSYWQAAFKSETATIYLREIR